ncbi:unnamed protein product [Spirodela intermedia]|uniref:Uncharacterized protein n=1 Tax=Spirodela intermedia TaxID=51605 RepID=A0A7I8L9U4_SPIIN|nr:unnamed protein product [Spirodela intermedia]
MEAAAAAAAEEEVQEELEAVVAVYGEDCRVLQTFPPHINFVEAVLGVRAGARYPAEPPHVILVESKGLDEERHEKLTTIVRNKAQELSSRPMLIALCEEAVDVLSDMNYPEGNCPLCLDPLFQQDSDDQSFPFMKLMSCFHCFHSDCILRWWHWLQQEVERNADNQFQGTRPTFSENRIAQDPHQANCPVCRTVFQSNDLEHILNLVETSASKAGADEEEVAGWDLLCSDEENRRREKFEALLRLQREHSGLIEPKKDLIVAPGMFLPEWASPASGGGDAAGELPAMASGSPPRAARRRGREGAGLTGGNIPAGSRVEGSGQRERRAPIIMTRGRLMGEGD